MHSYKLEVIIWNYILGNHRSSPPPCIEAVVDALYWDDIVKIRNGVCPYCGRKFSGRRGVISHLRSTGSVMTRHGIVYTNPCHLALERAVVYAEEMYRRVKSMIRYSRGYYFTLGKRYKDIYSACMDVAKSIMEEDE